MKPRHFPDLLQAWLEYMQDSAAPECYKKWSFLAVVAGCLERKVWLHFDRSGCYANLYTFLVGPPGSGKTTVCDEAIALMRHVPNMHFLASDINRASIHQDLSQVGKEKKFLYNKEQFPHSAAMLYASEASTTFTEQYIGGGIIPYLTHHFNCGTFGWDLTYGEKKSTRGSGFETLYNPCINLLACSTPEWLVNKCITKIDAAGGFGSRIIIAVSHENLEHRDTSFAAPAEIAGLELRNKIIADLRELSKINGPYVAHPSYVSAFNELARKPAAELEHAVKTGNYATRKMLHVKKLSMILAASRRNSLDLLACDIVDAWQLVAEVEPEMYKLMANFEMSTEAKLRNEILEFLERRKKTSGITQITFMQISQRWGNVENFKIEAAVVGLVQMGKLTKLATDKFGRLFNYVS